MSALKNTPQKGAGEAMPLFSEIAGNFKVVAPLTMEAIVEMIKGDTFKQSVTQIRKLLAMGKKEDADKLKKSLSGFTGSGTFFAKRKGENLDKYSQCLVLDFDKIPQRKINNLIRQINQSDYTLMSFISVSGCGIKIIVRVSSSQVHHKEAYLQVKKFYEQMIGIEADKNTHDIARLCYFSHDTNVYYNEAAEVFAVNLPIADHVVIESNMRQSETRAFFNKVLEFTNRKADLVEGNRNNYIHLLACNCNRYGILMDNTLEYIQSEISHGLTENEVKSCVLSAYSKNEKQFGEWASKEKKEQRNNELILTDIENCLRSVLSEFFNSLNQTNNERQRIA